MSYIPHCECLHFVSMKRSRIDALLRKPLPMCNPFLIVGVTQSRKDRGGQEAAWRGRTICQGWQAQSKHYPLHHFIQFHSIHYIADDELLYAAGNTVLLLNLKTFAQQCFTYGFGVSAIAVRTTLHRKNCTPAQQQCTNNTTLMPHNTPVTIPSSAFTLIYLRFTQAANLLQWLKKV